MSTFVQTKPPLFSTPPATITKTVAKVINIWWVLLLTVVFSTSLLGQSTLPQLKERLKNTSNLKQKASLNYKIAQFHLNARQPKLSVRYALASYNLSKQSRNTGLESGAALLMGKAFIADNDYSNANLWIKRGINSGKSIKSAPLVMEGSILLSSISVRQNNYKLAHEQLLVGINYQNRFPSSGKVTNNSSVDVAKLNQLQQQVRVLKKREAELLAQKGLSESELQERAASLEDSLKAIYAPTEEESLERQQVLIQAQEQLNAANETIMEADQRVKNASKVLGLPIFWWLVGFSLLVLGLLGGILWLWNQLNAQEEIAYVSEVPQEQMQTQPQVTQSPALVENQNWANQLRQKDLLIEDYKQELFDIQRKKSLAATLFAKGVAGAAKQKASIMLVNLGRKDSANRAAASPEKIQQLEKELELLIQQHPAIHFVNKMGPTLLFVSKPGELKMGTAALIQFAQELKEYFADSHENSWNAKIAVHSGWLVFAKSDNLPQGADVWGEELDRCSWLLGHTQPGNITITSDARDEIANPAGWTYLGEQRDFLGKEIRIFKKS